MLEKGLKVTYDDTAMLYSKYQTGVARIDASARTTFTYADLLIDLVCLKSSTTFISFIKKTEVGTCDIINNCPERNPP